jgi:Coenzyme PQQ synthesis protein D (PqqD)
MIFEEEVAVFPSGVLLEYSHLLDTVTGDEVPINESARLMLSLVDGRRTAREIGEMVAASYGVGAPRAVGDFLQLISRLNEKCLLNIYVPPASWRIVFPRRIKLVLINAVLGHVLLPWHRRRLDFCNGSKRLGFLSVARRLSLPATAMGSAVALPAWLLLGEALPSFWMALSIALAFAISLVLHEASHAIILAPVPAFLSLYGPVFLVGHGRVLYTNQNILAGGRAEAIGNVYLHPTVLIAVCGNLLYQQFHEFAAVEIGFLGVLFNFRYALPDGH